MDTKQIWVPVELHKRIKVLASNKSLTMTKYLDNLITLEEKLNI